MTNTESKAKQIAALNDAFRKGQQGPRGARYITHGISLFEIRQQRMIMFHVQNYANFAHDPFGEHDFGEIIYFGERIFWKIDTYADESLEVGAEDCTSPDAFRVLTIMLASEY